MQVTLFAGLVLALALAAAVWQDVKTRKIPNRLVMLGIVAALAMHAVLPRGAGLFAVDAGSLGVLHSLAGCAVGLMLLLPFYALKTLGAGDVKLMAMVGAFIGTPAVVGATLLSMLAGGVLALVVALWSGQLTQVLKNLLQMLRMASTAGLAAGIGPDADRAPVSGKLPYAVAIACGTGAQLLLADSPAWKLFS